MSFAKTGANLIIQVVMPYLKKKKLSLDKTGLTAWGLAVVAAAKVGGRISFTQAKKLVIELLEDVE